MDYPIAVRRRQEVVEGKPQDVVEIPSPTDIIPDDYAKKLITELNELPQAWVYVISRVLTRPTPKEFVAWREAFSGTEVAYVEPEYAIATRAALARIGVASDFEVLQTDVNPESVECLCKLTLKYWHNSQWSTMIATQWGDCARRSGMELGSSKKGAATDGMKKCLHELGWAVDVYSTEPRRLPPPDPAQLRLQNLETIYTMASGKGLTRQETDKFIANVTDGLSVETLEAKDITSIKRKIQKMTEKEVREVVYGESPTKAAD